jgi:KaiC/GvpD/RAD55 family RecA-like ATPase
LEFLDSRIPTEIVGALKNGSFSLHIKGSAGTGKTTLLLELLNMLSQRQGTVTYYLSTRVSPDNFLKQFPWIEKSLIRENILDARKVSIPTLDVEHPIFDYVDKPDFIRTLYSKILDSNGNNVTVAIDSLDSLKNNLLLSENDLSVENTLLEIGEKTNSNMIFVSEKNKECRLDYLVNGVIKLERELINKRLLRELVIEKMRGVEIENPIYIFTLKGGRFTKLALTTTSPPKDIQPLKTSDLKGDVIPTTIAELDNILGGGFKKGSLNFFEVSKMVGIDHAYIILPMLTDLISKGLPLFLIPSNGVSLPDARIFTKPILENKEFRKRLERLIHVFKPSAPEGVKELMGSLYSIKGENFYSDLEDFKKIVKNALNELRVDSFLCAIGSDTMEYIYGPQNFTKVITSWATELKLLNGVTILYKCGQEYLEPPTHLATTYFKIEKMLGTIMLYGEIPRTKLYAVAVDPVLSFYKTRLIPIE